MFARNASIGESSLQQDFRIDVGMKSIGDVLGGMTWSNLNISSDVSRAKTKKHFKGSISILTAPGGPESAIKPGSTRTGGTMFASFLATSPAMPDNLLIKK